MASAVWSTFEYLALDFLVAASYLFANTGQQARALQFLDFVLAQTDPQGYLASRALQLLGSLSNMDIDGENLAPDDPGGNVDLADLVRHIRF